MARPASTKLHALVTKWEHFTLTNAEFLLAVARIVCAVDKQELAENARQGKTIREDGN